MQENTISARISSPIRKFSGVITVPGDKSISHRALMFGGMATGTTKVTNLLSGHDVLNTKSAMEALGATITKISDSEYEITGTGVGGLKEPNKVLDFGNAGTGARLTMGIVATYDFATTFSGDASLCKRPMARILNPLAEFGATAYGRSEGRLPLTLVGAHSPAPITYTPPMASAQVKSAVLLAGLNCAGETKVIEKVKTRDHTEKMLAHFGANIETGFEDGNYISVLSGHATLRGKDVEVPADPSSAAFPIVTAIITPDSEVTVTNVLLNPDRTGIFTTLKEMGADITISNERIAGGETVGDITAKSSELVGITVPQERAASMIDEYPILCIAATHAKGDTIMRGIEELRVKESDRIHAMVSGLKKVGAYVKEYADGMVVTGGQIKGGAEVETFMDHRIAMSFLIAGTIAEQPISIDNGAFIATSFPGFETLMNNAGMNIQERHA